MMVYRDPELKHINYDKAEYYNKIAIKQNVAKSRFLLASLYTHHMKDKSKIEDSIKLCNEDLMIEKNWASSMVLASIYLSPKEYGAEHEPNIIKPLAYTYVTRDLRNGRYEDETNNVDNRFIEAMQTELSAEQLRQAKALYLELTAKMNETSTNNTDNIKSVK